VAAIKIQSVTSLLSGSQSWKHGGTDKPFAFSKELLSKVGLFFLGNVLNMWVLFGTSYRRLDLTLLAHTSGTLPFLLFGIPSLETLSRRLKRTTLWFTSH
jgi:hypothetical protein